MIVLYLHYFKCEKKERKKELDFCVKHNINNSSIDKIYLLLENENNLENWMINSKTEIVNVNKRMNFKDMFEFINGVEKDDINIICNLDMFFDNNISLLKEKELDNVFIALTRWNIDVVAKKANFFNVNCSQDTWIWKGKVNLSELDLNFGFGEPGCDNAICGEFHEAGWKVINPSLDLKSYHLHQETTRSYTDDDVVRKRLFLLYPTEDWDRSLIQYWKDCTNYIPFK
jgi:hypothetical protein